MKTKIFIITILIAATVKAQQDYIKSMLGLSKIERSPNVAAFMRYGNYPVNEFTGLPEINIPIYTIKEKDFKCL